MSLSPYRVFQTSLLLTIASVNTVLSQNAAVPKPAIDSRTMGKKAMGGSSSAATRHFENLMNGMRNGEKLRSPIHEGNISVTMLQLSNVAWKVNRTLQLDTKTAHVLGDDKANAMGPREHEQGWEPKI